MVKNISGANQDILSWIKENQYEQLNSFLSQHGNHERDSLLNSISITPLGVLRTNLDVLLLLKDRGMQFTRDAETMLQIKSYFNPRSKDNPNTDNPETSASQSPENKISSNIGFFALLSALGSIIKDFFSNKPGIAVKDEQKVSAVHKPQQTQSGHDSLNNSHEKMKNAFVPGVQRKDIRSIIPNPEPLVVIDDAESKNDSANIEPEDPLLGDLEEGSGRFEAKQVSLTSKSRTTQRKTSDNKTRLNHHLN